MASNRYAMASAGAPSEVEETLKRLEKQKGVIGVVIVNQDGIPIRTTLDQAKTVQYAGLITQLCAKARSAVRELDPEVCVPSPLLASILCALVIRQAML